MSALTITSMTVEDIRFPTSLQKGLSDAMINADYLAGDTLGDGRTIHQQRYRPRSHKSPDLSCPYVILKTDGGLEGYGSSFTAGRGNTQVCEAIRAFESLVVGVKLQDVTDDFGSYWQSLASEDQMRWLGPEKGVTHMAIGAIINAIWDLWAKMEGQPLWKLLVDMEPEKLVSTIDFRYMGDTLTKQEALEMLKKSRVGWKKREEEMKASGFPAYTTSCGWLGYPDDKIKQLATEALDQGWTWFKIKIGADIQGDIRRARVFRESIGYECLLMTDANQRWEVQEAIDWMKKMAPYKPLWIEEPTSPDDILGHAAIAEALKPLGIGVATGEVCQNRVMFKQFLKANAMQYCQIDACRVGGVNENLAIILLAKKFGVPVCPHGGGVALCEYVQHFALWDYICVAGTLENRMLEYASHLHEHLKAPVAVKNGNYQVATEPGFLVGLLDKTRQDYSYPNGLEWQKLFKEGLFKPE